MWSRVGYRVKYVLLKIIQMKDKTCQLILVMEFGWVKISLDEWWKGNKIKSLKRLLKIIYIVNYAWKMCVTHVFLIYFTP